MYLLGATSGGHVNPAVTWALFLDRRISIVRTVLYIIAQFVGGFAGAGRFNHTVMSRDHAGRVSTVVVMKGNRGCYERKL